MLNIYYGRENVDKEAFMYQEIRKAGYGPDRRVLILVPDQYTLEAERQAFRWLGTRALVGLEVSSLSRLGHNILRDLGGARKDFVDKYGRQMLLTRIARAEADELEIFGESVNKPGFIELTNDFISGLKQYGVTPDGLAEMAASEDHPLLRKKLTDLARIYGKYQAVIAGKYTDSEDYIDLYLGRIAQSRRVVGARVWVYGFDSFAPKSLEVLTAIMGAADQVNVVLTMDKGSRDASLFSLTRLVADRLREGAEASGAGVGRTAMIRAVAGGALPLDDAAAGDAIPLDDAAAGDALSGGPAAPAAERPASPLTRRAASIAWLERELYASPPRPFRGRPAGITLTECGNVYSEAETAAAFVLHLLRDEGYRRRDIVIICSDQETRAPIVRRTFEEYGLPLFTDTKRDIQDAEAAVYLTAVLRAVARRYRQQDVIRALKTSLSGLTGEEVERLEDYAIRYRITGTRWCRPFNKGALDHSFGPEALADLEDLRQRAMAPLLAVEALCRKKQTTKDFIKAFYQWLVEEDKVEEKILAAAEAQRAEGLPDLADATVQVWNRIVGILGQIAELVGEDRFRTEDFLELFTAGLKATEVGILPSSPDDLVLGTMQRTRTAAPRAVVVLGANEGVLPQAASGKGLFAEEELEAFADSGHELGRLDSVRIQEERLAIYRNLSRPTDQLYISWAAADQEGKEIRPSILVDDIRDVFPDLSVARDILSPAPAQAGAEPSAVSGGAGWTEPAVDTSRLTQEWEAEAAGAAGGEGEDEAAAASASAEAVSAALASARGTAVEASSAALAAAGGAAGETDTDLALVGGEASTLRHLAEGLSRAARQRDQLSPVWHAVRAWYRKRRPAEAARVRAGLREDNQVPPLSPEHARILFRERGGLRLISPSGIERYARCPFAGFVDRGLRPEERRIYEAGSRENGDLYHATIMRVTRALTEGRLWGSVTEAGLRDLVRRELTAESDSYKEGLFHYSGRETYRAGRLERACLDTLSALVDQYQAGDVKESRFEAAFGPGQSLPPIELNEDGTKVCLEGRIDRLDILANDRLKVIDYKSGNNQFHLSEVRAGYSLQLMVYLKAAEQEGRKPAGVFYFYIREPRVNSAEEDLTPEELSKELRKAFQMNGLMVDDPETVREVAGDFEGSSPVIKATRKKDGTFSQDRSAALISEEGFRELEEAVSQTLSGLARNMTRGEISISPMRVDASRGACTHCQFRGICRFDVFYAGNRYRALADGAAAESGEAEPEPPKI